MANFNSHAHVERDFSASSKLPSSINFNSHAHVERDALYDMGQGITHISTHTLTWSVTFSIHLRCPPRLISTHTLTWSVTYLGILDRSRSAYFNSHAHVERDGYRCRHGRHGGHFNSHAHVERDDFIVYLDCRVNISTHTLTWSVTISL